MRGLLITSGGKSWCVLGSFPFPFFFLLTEGVEASVRVPTAPDFAVARWPRV
jgi:hypothetical protein